MTYPMTVAGLRRDLPICKVTDDLYIGAFIVFGDAELTVACARELLKLVPAEDYDYMLTAEAKRLYLGRDDAELIRGKRILLMDDVISTGGSLHAMEQLVALAGGTVTGRVAVLAEGEAAERSDIKFLEKLPVFNADGTIKE